MITVRRVESAVMEGLLGLSRQEGGRLLDKYLHGTGGSWSSRPSNEQSEAITKMIDKITYDHRTGQAALRFKSPPSPQQELTLTVRKPTFDRNLRSHGPERPVSTRLGRVMALAIFFEDLLKKRQVQDFVALGRRAGISTSRVSQILKLRNLAPALQERILFMTENESKINEIALRRIAEETVWERQSKAFHQLLD
jgi:hypothetical protein